jgi:hypothetical protein
MRWRSVSAGVRRLVRWLGAGEGPACLGCGRSPREAAVVRGPSVGICRACLDEAVRLLRGQRAGAVVGAAAGWASPRAIRCAFCSARAAESAGTAAWPRGAICGDCILVADEVLAEQEGSVGAASRPAI